MNIEVVLSPVFYESRNIKNSHVTVAVDVLRATSAVCAAFAAGVDEIVPLDSLEMLGHYASIGYLIAAERGGLKLEGATCGNSPTEYASMDLSGRRLAFSTTNGTVSILRSADASRSLVGSFANLSALASVLKDYENVVVLCSGWKGDPSLEDTVFAGALIDRLMSMGVETALVNDAAMMALDLWHAASSDLYAYCAKATHVHRLLSYGYADDIKWCLTADSCDSVPELIEGKLVRAEH